MRSSRYFALLLAAQSIWDELLVKCKYATLPRPCCKRCHCVQTTPPVLSKRARTSHWWDVQCVTTDWSACTHDALTFRCKQGSWTKLELKRFKTYLPTTGLEWTVMSEMLGTKRPEECLAQYCDAKFKSGELSFTLHANLKCDRRCAASRFSFDRSSTLYHLSYLSSTLYAVLSSSQCRHVYVTRL
jgi:hypothetical protein